VIADARFGLLKRRRRSKTPPSQIAEMERLYFRAIREMLNDHPNIVQVINDLQRILATDPHYKNTRHYLNRALTLQAQTAASGKDSTLPQIAMCASTRRRRWAGSAARTPYRPSRWR
jgi:hypothetical protein